MWRWFVEKLCLSTKISRVQQGNKGFRNLFNVNSSKLCLKMSLFRTAPEAEDKCFCKYYKECFIFSHKAYDYGNYSFLHTLTPCNYISKNTSEIYRCVMAWGYNQFRKNVIKVKILGMLTNAKKNCYSYIIKGAVSRQSSSFCLVFPITRP